MLPQSFTALLEWIRLRFVCTVYVLPYCARSWTIGCVVLCIRRYLYAHFECVQRYSTGIFCLLPIATVETGQTIAIEIKSEYVHLSLFASHYITFNYLHLRIYYISYLLPYSYCPTRNWSTCNTGAMYVCTYVLARFLQNSLWCQSFDAYFHVLHFI